MTICYSDPGYESGEGVYAMSFYHKPVMLQEAVRLMNIQDNGVYLDGTLGGGGHSEAILHSGARLLYGIDRDPAAIRAAGVRLAAYPGFTAIHGNFHDAKALLQARGVTRLDGAILDLGVSSHQLDTPERGFSYHGEAPLDMRMDPDQGETAARFLARADEKTLTKVFLEYGEEAWASRIAKIIVERRAVSPLLTTADLVAAVDKAIPAAIRRKSAAHPARRVFQAIRIAVNDELAPLAQAIEDIMSLVCQGGRVIVITFHSLEDRIVKNVFRTMQNPCICPPKAPLCVCGRKPIGKVLGLWKPREDEVAMNPRSAGAKLRAAEHI